MVLTHQSKPRKKKKKKSNYSDCARGGGFSCGLDRHSFFNCHSRRPLRVHVWRYYYSSINHGRKQCRIFFFFYQIHEDRIFNAFQFYEFIHLTFFFFLFPLKYDVQKTNRMRTEERMELF